jgi:hypothetical protein
MDPMPMPVAMAQGQLLVMLASVIGGILVIVGFILWAARHAYEERRRVRCPVRHRMARILFRLAPDGVRTDVIRCSLLGEAPASTCGGRCLR